MSDILDKYKDIPETLIRDMNDGDIGIIVNWGDNSGAIVQRFNDRLVKINYSYGQSWSGISFGSNSNNIGTIKIISKAKY